MKAVVYEEYGPPEVLKLTEVEKPVPKDNEILIKIRATTAHIGDVRMRKADPYLVRLISGLFRPRRIPILGIECAGEVESAGKEITRFTEGDAVFALVGFGFGGYAEYICMPEEGKGSKKGLVAEKPSNLSFEEAAAVPAGGITALTVLRTADIHAGTKVMIYGASGSVGTYSVQLANYWGAEVTGVCGPNNAELVRSLGAARIIDYTTADLTECGEIYDVVFDAVDKLPVAKGKTCLRKGGTYLRVGRDSGDGKELHTEDLVFLKELCERGKLKPVIDRRYSLDQIIEAHRYVEQGHKKGNVAVTVE